MDIALCSLVNEEYAVGLVALLKSLRHHNPGVALPFLVYISRPLSAGARQQLEAAYPRIEYRLIERERYARCRFTNYRDWGMNPAFRYELFRETAYEQLIYLDADMLVHGDIAPLLAFRGALGACPMPPGEGMELRNIGGFNAGLLNIGRAVRTPQIWRQLVELAEANAWSGNQTVLNLVLKQHVQPLPLEYNVGTSHMTPEKLEGARIIHYLGKRKPWQADRPFDRHQMEHAGEAMCATLLQVWNAFAPGVAAQR
ncbi:hypothetical protein GTP38_24660 [Duganella sp. FT94W]|uniref:Glycosyltransferase family 8 protein n=1 Tax=Duganella lactea TaxID=2692173 RepID=A0ABW9VG11_9BURK|nr:glycosyltransferase [Duganella lactea]MYM37523.1 hypothetical protein [Duganella lactea]